MATSNRPASDAANRQHHERDYIERTIATVRNHQGADNCWPQWANIFADEIERLWKIEDRQKFADLAEKVMSGDV